MFNNSSKILFFMIMISGTLITISSTSWLGSWMGLEINLLSFIPLMNNTSNLMSTETSLKYFLVQAMASTIMLFCIIMSMLKSNMFFQLNHYLYLNVLLTSSLMLKSGAAPFHFWFPQVMEGLTWINNLILMTWQKIAPLMLISYLNNNNYYYLFIISSIIIGAIGGLNQTSVKKIMSFSSINHLGWMLTSMMSSNSLWIIYFLFYCLLSTTLILFFYSFQIIHINQLFSMFFSSKMLKFSLFLNILSLGGLPPFLGFLPKWLVINFLVIKYQLMLLMVMVMCSLITLFFYLRMCYISFMLNFFETSWHYKMNYNKKMINLYMFLSFFSIFSLMLMSPLILNFI